MKRTIVALLFVMALSVGALAQSAPPLRVTEVDGSPSRTNVTRLNFPSGTLTVSGQTVTYTPTGGAGLGSVTNTGGALTLNRVVLGAGVDDVKVDSGILITGTTTTLDLTVGRGYNGQMITLTPGVDLVPATFRAFSSGTNPIQQNQTSANVLLGGFAHAGALFFADGAGGAADTFVSRNAESGAVGIGTTAGATNGALTVATVNKVAITAPATLATLAIADGKTLTVNNTLTINSTDGITMTTPTESFSVARTDASQSFTGIQIFASPRFTTSATTTSTTFSLLNTTATTVNAFGATTTLNLGASAAMVLNFGGSDTASEFRFLEPSASGTNYSAFKAVAQAASITYSLPPAAIAGGALRDVLGDGVLEWSTAFADKAGANTFTTAQLIHPLTDVTPLTLRRASAPAASNLLSVQDESNNVLASISSAGNILAPGFTATGQSYYINTGQTVSWKAGTGSPEGVVTAGIGSIWSQTDGTTDTALWRKETGAGNTGWVAVAAGGGGGLTIGTTTITSGTTGRPLYDNGGVLGEMTVTGTGTVAVLATSPTLVTPVLGIATGTTISLGAGSSVTAAVGVGTANTGFYSTSAGNTVDHLINGNRTFQTTSSAIIGVATNFRIQLGGSQDVEIGRAAAATFRIGLETSSGAATAQTLTVSGSSGNSAAAALFTIAGSDQTGTTTTGGGIKLRGGNGTSAGGAVEIWTSATTTPAVAASFGADKGVTFISLAGSGSRAVLADANGLLSAPVSDARLKTNIQPITQTLNVLSALSKLEGDYFNYNQAKMIAEKIGDFGSQREIGLTYQNVHAVLPELTGMQNGYGFVKYDQMVAFLIEVAKAQQAEIETLKAKVH